MAEAEAETEAKAEAEAGAEAGAEAKAEAEAEAEAEVVAASITEAERRQAKHPTMNCHHYSSLYNHDSELLFRSWKLQTAI